MAIFCIKEVAMCALSAADNPVDLSYCDYLRVYTPVGTRLLNATPQSIPDSWMILSRHVAPRVDVLDETWPGLQGFGTLIVVPGGGTVNTGMRFGLPAARILAEGPDHSMAYQLNIKKQPGTLDIPLTIRIHLPAGALLESPPDNWVVDGRNILIQTGLRVDVHLQVVFR
jgi:hypothetical protein